MWQVIVLIVVGVYALTAIIIYLFQERFIFLGKPIPQDHVYEFAAPFEERTYDTPMGGRINALYFKASNPRGVIYYHHGNGGELPRWGEVSYFFLEQGYDVLLYDYRGYGKSTGRRTETRLLSDALFMYERLLEAWPESQIVVYGRSLGTGLASFVAGRHHPAKVILETPFYSLTEMAARYFPLFPSRYLVQYHFPSAQYLAKATAEVHIFHGTEDLIVPYSSGRKLYESLSSTKAYFYTVTGADHHNLLDYEEYRREIHRLLAS